MNADEVRGVAKILLTADQGCMVCACLLFQEFDKAFPGHAAILSEVWSTTEWTDEADGWKP